MTSKQLEEMMRVCAKGDTDHVVTNNILLLMCRLFFDIKAELNVLNQHLAPRIETIIAPTPPVGYDGKGML